MKVSGAKVAENRAALVATAGKLLKERGFDGAGVAEISREAGLTQGALYGRFKSREGLVAEALRTSLADACAFLQGLRESAPDVLAAYLDAYVSDEHVNDLGMGCMIATCVSDIPRQSDEIATAFAEGFRRLVENVQGAFPNSMTPETARRRAIALLCGMVGGVALARAVKAADRGLAREVVAAARQELENLALCSITDCLS